MQSKRESSLVINMKNSIATQNLLSFIAINYEGRRKNYTDINVLSFIGIKKFAII